MFALDTIIDANIMHMFATFENFEVLKELIPQVYNVKPVFKATDSKFVLSSMLYYPWPISDRELIVHITGAMDYANKGILTLSKFK